MLVHTSISFFVVKRIPDFSMTFPEAGLALSCKATNLFIPIFSKASSITARLASVVNPDSNTFIDNVANSCLLKNRINLVQVNGSNKLTIAFSSIPQRPKGLAK